MEQTAQKVNGLPVLERGWAKLKALAPKEDRDVWDFKDKLLNRFKKVNEQLQMIQECFSEASEEIREMECSIIDAKFDEIKKLKEEMERDHSEFIGSSSSEYREES